MLVKLILKSDEFTISSRRHITTCVCERGTYLQDDAIAVNHIIYEAHGDVMSPSLREQPSLELHLCGNIRQHALAAGPNKRG